LEDRIPADHPLRGVRKLVDKVLAEMSKDFDGLYSLFFTDCTSEKHSRSLLIRASFHSRWWGGRTSRFGGTCGPTKSCEVGRPLPKQKPLLRLHSLTLGFGRFSSGEMACFQQ
jgi:hypothetical protein